MNSGYNLPLPVPWNGQTGNPSNPYSYMPDWQTGGNGAPGEGPPAANAPGGTPWYQNPTLIGSFAAAAGSFLNSWQANKNAKANQKAVTERQQYLDRTAGNLAWQGPIGNEGALQGLIGGNGQNNQQLNLTNLFGFNPMANTSQDSIMQMLRGGGDKSIFGGMLATGNPFDTSDMFKALQVTDARNTNAQVAGLRSGAAGMGQRFGGSMMQQEGRLRQGIAENLNVRNAGIQMNAYEAAQGRRTSTLDQLLRGAGMNMDAARQNQTLQLAAISQMFNQQLGQRNYNMNLFGIQSGIPIGQNTAPGYGSAIGDLGQLLAMYPMMQGEADRARRGATNTGRYWG